MNTTDIILTALAAGFATYGLCHIARMTVIALGRRVVERIRWHRSAPDTEAIDEMVSRIREQLAADAARSPVTQDPRKVDEKRIMWARAN